MFRSCSRAVTYAAAFTIAATATGVCHGAEKKKRAPQYKKQNREQITRIARGETASVLRYCEKYLAEKPKDIEALYIRTLALAREGKTKEASESLEQALEAGATFDRFIAGPRSLTMKTLNGTPRYRLLLAQHRRFLVHGPVVGSVTSSAASFWVRTAMKQTVRVRVMGEDGREAASGTARSSPEDDYTCVVRVKGLMSDARYTYAVEVDGGPVRIKPTPSFRTSPPVSKSSRFDIGWGGGAGYTPWHEHMWLTILKRKPRAFLLLGDNVYIDTPTVRETQQYCYYRRQSRPEYRRFAASTPVYAIWDDHDFGTNDCVSTPKLDDPPWKLDVLDVFKENFVNPAYGVGKEHPGCYFNFSIGDVDFIMLDCRFYREHPKRIESPSMLGEYQKKWLLERLSQSTGTFKVVCSSVPWARGTKGGSKDTWDGFDDEREEIFRHIAEGRIEGVMLLSADRHRSDAWKTERPGAYPLYDLMSSRLTNVHTHGIVKGCLFGYNEKCSFGLLSFDTTLDDPTVTYRVVNIDNEVKHTLTIGLSELKFR